MKTIHFKNGDTKKITQENLNKLIEVMTSTKVTFQSFIDGTNVFLTINTEEILYID